MSIFATRGQTDMRGLDTAGRLFGRNGAAALVSSVATVGSRILLLLIAVSQVVPHAAGLATDASSTRSWGN